MATRSARTADRAQNERNLSTLKVLLKEPGNKFCADCKTADHPRWASWSLGVFICIRCSGIHRSMGTHVSRVKSVDLDAWTNEQLDNMVRWGNVRANKYWEHGLSPGHVPSDSKIDNFIRTKYDMKRWVMPGPMPDPDTLDDGDEEEDVLTSAIKQKVETARAPASSNVHRRAPSLHKPTPPKPALATFDLLGGDDFPPAAPSAPSAPVTRAKPPVLNEPATKASAAPPKPADSLLGLDFFSSSSSSGPSTTGPAAGSIASKTATGGRADLKTSILSLYASVPQKSPRPQQQQTYATGGYQSGYTSPPVATTPSAASGAMGDLASAFGGFGFSSTPAQPQPQPTGASSTLSSLNTPNLWASSTAQSQPPRNTTGQASNSKQEDAFGGLASFGNFTSSSFSRPKVTQAQSFGGSAATSDLWGSTTTSASAGISSGNNWSTSALPAQTQAKTGDHDDFGDFEGASAATGATAAKTSGGNAFGSFGSFEDNPWS
ncbi:ArfGap-domain-containing protein [Saitoella complicata NRRL Y-17804]|uniref:ArfGap-domain-containing protein n=1 Tax=Saitoella complicata (strain BCRC 22490 / CBS 7301 / JCM 7358 / NBRC 10748 / NRRL Y-17804) TaxID=698492 RepID=UPI000866A616|nr:ArfGap-domain-containing protein [Saitoella complicata NRRL Y-17804]ODQ53826.1 ArfGap-domain-containing protein [Saitoella complicata NRRL Y-17804]